MDGAEGLNWADYPPGHVGPLLANTEQEGQGMLPVVRNGDADSDAEMEDVQGGNDSESDDESLLGSDNSEGSLSPYVRNFEF